MWDTAEAPRGHLSHDLPCVYCGHGPHHFLPCDEACECPGGTDLLAPGESATR